MARYLLALVCILGSSLPIHAQTDEWKQLFDGKDLTGWKAHPKFPGNWRVVNNVLAGFAPNPGFLATTRTDYKDFHLRMEVRFFAPGGLVSNLDFVESIFGNAGDPFVHCEGQGVSRLRPVEGDPAYLSLGSSPFEEQLVGPLL